MSFALRVPRPKRLAADKNLICVLIMLPPPLSDGLGSPRQRRGLDVVRVGEEGRRQEGGREEAVERETLLYLPSSSFVHTCSEETKTLGM